MSRLTKVVTVLFIFFACIMVGGVITSILSKIYDIPLDATVLTPDMTREINFIKLFQCISAFFTFILPPLLIAISLSNKNASGYLKLDKTPDIKYYLLVFLFMLASMPLMNIIIEYNNSIVLPESLKWLEDWMRSKEDSSQAMIDIMASGTSRSDLIINIFVMAIIPAIGEEFLFRGIIQKYLNKILKNHHIAIIFTAIIFSAVHLQFYGFIPRMLLGMFFGYLVHYTGSLWSAIFAHFANNLMAVITYFLIGKDIINNEVENIGTQSADIWYVITGTVLAVLAGIYLFKKKPQRKHAI